MPANDSSITNRYQFILNCVFPTRLRASSDDQFGCIKGSSAVDALVEIVHKWYEATDTLGTYVRILLLDFSKAFDRINHDILLEKLRLCGLPPHLLRWKAAFLLDRTQRVKVNNKMSTITLLNGGVPQGTLSGPKDFLIYINDLNTPAHNICKYVDDSTIYEIVQGQAESCIQQSADVSADWTRLNDMIINSDKSKEMSYVFQLILP